MCSLSAATRWRHSDNCYYGKDRKLSFLVTIYSLITGNFNSSLRVFLRCNFAISLLSSIRFSVALSTVFGFVLSYNNA